MPRLGLTKKLCDDRHETRQLEQGVMPPFAAANG
jgi:hypothetical protein